MKLSKISVIHPYLENRYNETLVGLYPKNHLWGLDAIKSQEEWVTNFIDTDKIIIPSLLEKFLDRYIFLHSPGVKAEIAAWRASKTSNLIYSICGPLSLSRFYKNTKLISWVFRKPSNISKRILNSYSTSNLKSHSGFLCLTPDAECWFSQYSTSQFIPWCVDLDIFDGKPTRKKTYSKFFLATGKSNRDYKTLIQGSKSLAAVLKIIGPNHLRPSILPKNVMWLDTSVDPPDQAIDYPTLREWYAQCIGVCIPLLGDAEDTCGYTNMLEGMAMRKPVIMTRSGCLHIDPSSRNFGMLVEPGDSKGWSDAMNHILNDEHFASECGGKAREIAEEEFSIERFNRDVVYFINKVLKN